MAQVNSQIKDEEIRRLKKAFWVFASNQDDIAASRDGHRVAAQALGPRADAEQASRLALGGSSRRESVSGAGANRNK